MEEYSLGLYEKAMPQGVAFSQLLKWTKAGGFDRMELSVDESDQKLARLNWTKLEIDALRQDMDQQGVPIRTMCLSGHRKYPLGSHDPEVRKASLEIMEKAILLAARLSIPLIQLAGYDVYYEEGGEETRKWFQENLEKSLRMAATAGVCLGFETMETPFMDTVEKAMHYVDLFSSPYLGVYPDIGNLKNASVKYNTSLTEDLKKGIGHMYAAHLKETVPGIYRDRTFGDGHTEYEPCIKILWDAGVRMYTGEFWYDGTSDVEESLRYASHFLREKMEGGRK